MQSMKKISRRTAMQSIAFLPAVSALALQSPPATEQIRDQWNGIYSNQDSGVPGFPKRFLAEMVQGRKPGRALDVGMGQGRNSLFLARLGWDVTGVDVSDKGIDLAKKEAARLGLTMNYVLSDISAFDLGSDRWDLIVGLYVGREILFQASHLTDGLTSGGLLVVEHYRRDVGRISVSGGRLGYPINALLETFVPSLRIVRYEEVLDFPDWGDQGVRAPLVRMLASKG